MGAWIEIRFVGIDEMAQHVAPLVGAWIEIACPLNLPKSRLQSLPSWERGLKFESQIVAMRGRNVAPLVGAWIEITMR